MKRGSGVLMHISSLFGDYSIGGFSGSARYFIDFLSDCGFSYWQVLPFSPVDECNSPYKSCSAFGGNPYFVDLETLHKQGLLTKEELASCRQQTPYSCEFGKLYYTRLDILLAASKRVRNKEDIEAFIEERPYLEAFCSFMALKDANGQRCWIEWKQDNMEPERLFLWKFIQYTFFQQWTEIKEYANRKNIQIIGDLPFYVSYDSADVWGNPELFLLDDYRRPSCVAGVPPDYFAKDGQLWGNPIYDWKKMEDDGFAWWRDRLLHSLTLFDGVRIDHFRAIDSFWAVNAGAETAKDGQWMQGPGKKLVEVIQEIRGEKLIIAEDLGEITDSVRALVRDSGFPGMRVLQFGFTGEVDTPHMPHHYDNNVVAYTGTHDNNTLLGYVWELDDRRRQELLSYCGYTEPDWNRGYDCIIRTMFLSHAGLVIFPIQDLLGYGSDTRLNIPGKAEGNWQFRITKEQLDSIEREKYRALNRLYRR